MGQFEFFFLKSEIGHIVFYTVVYLKLIYILRENYQQYGHRVCEYEINAQVQILLASSLHICCL